MTDIEHGKDCCLQNLKDAKWVSRAKWVCPVCGKDVSVEFIRLQDCLNSTEAVILPDTERDKINQTIHEARGLCWHKYATNSAWECVCGYSNGGPPYGIASHLDEDNPDYTSDWSAWGEALEWAKWQEGFPKFLVEIIISYSPNTRDELLSASLNATLQLLNPLKGATALAEFIDKHPDIFKIDS